MPDVKTLLEEGNDLSKKKDWAEALERYRTATSLDPENADLHFLVGCCHFKMNHGPGARTAWERTLQLDPDHEKARKWIHRVTGLDFQTPVAERNASL